MAHQHVILGWKSSSTGRALRVVRRLAVSVTRVLVALLVVATSFSNESLAQQAGAPAGNQFAQNEIIIRFSRLSGEEAVGSKIDEDYANVAALALQGFSIPTEQVAIEPLFKDVVGEMRQQGLSENLALLSLVKKYVTTSDRFLSSVFFSHLQERNSRYGFARMFVIRFSSSQSVQTIISQINQRVAFFKDKNLEVRATRVFLSPAAGIKVESMGGTLPPALPACPDTRATVAVIGDQFISRPDLSQVTPISILNGSGSGCDSTPYQIGSESLGTNISSVISRVCPNCAVLGFDAGCGVGGRGFVRSTEGAQAVLQAVLRGAHVVLFTAADIRKDLVFEQALFAATNAGVVMVAPAGDESSTVDRYPAAIGGVIGVAARGSDGAISDFSNSGPWAITSARGKLIPIAHKQSATLTASGTSLAAARVAGLAGRYLARIPNAKLVDIGVLAASGGLSTPDPSEGEICPPTQLQAVVRGNNNGTVRLTWIDNSPSESQYLVMKRFETASPRPGEQPQVSPWQQLASLPPNSSQFVDRLGTNVVPVPYQSISYRVVVSKDPKRLSSNQAKVQVIASELGDSLLPPGGSNGAGGGASGANGATLSAQQELARKFLTGAQGTPVPITGPGAGTDPSKGATATTSCATALMPSGNNSNQETPIQACYTRTSPCPQISGSANPDLGSGVCTGNYQTVVEIPYVGAFIHNSNSPYRWRGFGAGFDFESERRVVRGIETDLVLNLGDGTTINLIPHTTRGVYRAADIRMNDSLFVVTSGEVRETTPGNETIIYRPTSRSGGFEIAEARDSHGVVAVYRRESDGRLSSIENEYGQRVIFKYDGNKNLESVTDSAGNENKFEMTSNTNYLGETNAFLTNVKLSQGLGSYALTYGLEPALAQNPTDKGTPLMYFGNVGRIGKILYPNGSRVDIGYNFSGDVSGITDVNAQLTTFEYSASEVIVRTLFSSMTETFSKGKLASMSKVLTGEGLPLSISLARDDLGRVSDVVHPTGEKITYEYQCGSAGSSGGACSANDIRAYNVTKVVRNNGATSQTTSLQYAREARDLQFDVESVSSQLPGGKTINTSYTYTSYPPFHLPVTETINGITTTYNYNGVGDVESTVAPTGTTKMSYNSMGDVTAITDAFGRTTGYGYDSVGNLESVTDHFGRKSTVKYDSLGRPIQADSPLSSVTKNYPPPSNTSYEEQLTSKVGDITTSVRSVSKFSERGRRVSDQVDMDIGKDRFQVQRSYRPELGFDVPGSVTVTTPMIAGAKVKDDSSDFTQQAAPVPAE